ncbi:IS630 family transposase [Cyanothece sp. BG0011]|uniref:IS630 family transposase n=2 Tax=Cyanothece sp. BG0011 TaxID=2082950 RepID=UPI001E327564|nr:IS630 family transposase [Cyanothece sp. BG0011]
MSPECKTHSRQTVKSSQATTERVQGLRFNYWKQVKKVDMENLVFIDEMGANLALARRYARSLQGTRAYSQQPFYPGQHLSLIGAIALKGFIGGMTLEGGINGIAFQVFLDKVLLPQLWPGACVVMDNLPAHKVKGVQEKIQSVGASLIYLSPYSPDFNPIENCWSKLKAYLRKVAARSRETLEKAISFGLDLITECDIRNWFAHCCYCTS